MLFHVYMEEGQAIQVNLILALAEMKLRLYNKSLLCLYVTVHMFVTRLLHNANHHLPNFRALAAFAPLTFLIEPLLCDL